MSATPVCRADPVALNGSFESPSIGANHILAGGGTSWTANNSSVFIVSNNFGGNGTTPFGSQYLGLTSPGASDQQTISGFLSGQDYVLELYISDIANNANPKLQVSITGAASATQTFSAPQAPGLSFLQEQIPFTATSDGDITLTLLDFGSASIAVDNVSVAAVPEPSSVTAMLLLAGTVTINAVRRFRRRG